MDIIESLFAGPDISVLRIVIFLLLLSVFALLVPSIPAFRKEKRLAALVVVILSLMAVMGLSNQQILGIVTGSSTGLFVLLLLLPLIAFMLLYMMKGDGLGITVLRLGVVIVVLASLYTLENYLREINPSLLDTTQAGMFLGDVITILYGLGVIALVFFGFQFIARVFFKE